MRTNTFLQASLWIIFSCVSLNSEVVSIIWLVEQNQTLLSYLSRSFSLHQCDFLSTIVTVVCLLSFSNLTFVFTFSTSRCWKVVGPKSDQITNIRFFFTVSLFSLTVFFYPYFLIQCDTATNQRHTSIVAVANKISRELCSRDFLTLICINEALHIYNTIVLCSMLVKHSCKYCWLLSSTSNSYEFINLNVS